MTNKPVKVATPSYLKRLSKGMQELLLECHKREEAKAAPVNFTEKSAAALLTRKMVMAKHYTDYRGKRLMCLFITARGKEFVNKLHTKSMACKRTS